MSKDNILNIALRLLGEPNVTGVNDTSSWVQRCRNVYDEAVRSTFEDYPWNFPEEIVKLTPSDPTPLDWAYGFTKPALCRRINWVRDTVPSQSGSVHDRESISYKVRQNRILANVEEIYLWYVDGKWESLEGAWPQKFADLIGAEIAHRVYPATDESDRTAMRLERNLKRSRRDAKAYDGQADPPQELPHGSFTRARGGYGRGYLNDSGGY